MKHPWTPIPQSCLLVLDCLPRAPSFIYKSSNDRIYLIINTYKHISSDTITPVTDISLFFLNKDKSTLSLCPSVLPRCSSTHCRWVSVSIILLKLLSQSPLYGFHTANSNQHSLAFPSLTSMNHFMLYLFYVDVILYLETVPPIPD